MYFKFSTCASLLHPKVVELLMTLMLKGVLHFYSQGSSCIEFKCLFCFQQFLIFLHYLIILKYFCIINLHSQIVDIAGRVMFTIIVLWIYWGLPYSFASILLNDQNAIRIPCLYLMVPFRAFMYYRLLQSAHI